MGTQGVPSQSAQIQNEAEGPDSTSASFADLDIENTNIQTASGAELSSQQKVIVGSVLDVCLLFLYFPFPRFPRSLGRVICHE